MVTYAVFSAPTTGPNAGTMTKRESAATCDQAWACATRDSLSAQHPGKVFVVQTLAAAKMLRQLNKKK